MKFKFFFYILPIIFAFQNVSNAWDSTAAKFYPLNVGNVYIYEHFNLWFNCDPSGLSGRYIVRITDYVPKPNGKKYFKFSGWWYNSPSWNYQRIDSNSMNVYVYDTTNNSEYLIDSLLINPGNHFTCNRFNRLNSSTGTCFGISLQNIFGRNRTLKNHGAPLVTSSITGYYSLIEGIGFPGYSACELGSGETYSLMGCIINGIVYGDTTLTGVHQFSNIVPERYSLHQNYPNPFNPKQLSITNYQLRITFHLQYLTTWVKRFLF